MQFLLTFNKKYSNLHPKVNNKGWVSCGLYFPETRGGDYNAAKIGTVWLDWWVQLGWTRDVRVTERSW